jgi:hypothetical protein
MKGSLDSCEFWFAAFLNHAVDTAAGLCNKWPDLFFGHSTFGMLLKAL